VFGSFADDDTKNLALCGQISRRLPFNIQRVAQRKLAQIQAVTHLHELAIPPGNKLEKLRGPRAGQYSIRINVQWRICFSWKEHRAYDIEIVDYH
jgi:proteic killer suppression protein